MIRIDLIENGSPIEVEIADRDGVALSRSGLVTAAPALAHGWWTIGPAGKVGVAQIADVELWIKPKLDIRRLLFLVGFATDHKIWRDEHLGLTEETDLLSAMAAAFARQADKATQRGLLQGYRVQEDALPVLRGRLRSAEQLTRRYGLAVPIEVRFDEYGVDVPENQLLRGAAEVLLRVPGVDSRTRRRLLRLVRSMADVTPARRGRVTPAWQASRLNARYHIALRLAELVLRSGSVEQKTGAIMVNGFMLDMARVFEDFLTVALGDALMAYDGHCKAQDRWHLDEADEITMRPDLVWYRRDGELGAVVDAKYKAEKPSGFPYADLYQMLAYCTALGLPRGHLVYAKGNEPEATHVVRNAGVEIVQHTLDLDHSPHRLLAQVERLAQAIRSPASQGCKTA
ncbi:McrC family protein [Terrabacter sp. 2TAF16]|uniref:McrC family protein n=1 Tax=Terrabacter sp. 2TAF16 TaxID=3233008 RepID=UPI003F9B8066